MKPKILVSSNSLNHGGAAIWTYDIIANSKQYFDHLGLCVPTKQVDPDTLPRFRTLGVPIFIGSEGIDELKPDLILAWGAVQSFVNVKAPILWVLHGRSWAMVNQARSMMDRKDFFIGAVSDACLAVLPEEVSSKVRVIENGIDFKRLEPLQSRQEVRKKYRLEDKFVVGYIGRIVAEKNLTMLVNAIKLLDERFYGFFVGKGSQPYVDQLKQHLGNRGLLIGEVSDVGTYFRALDCHVLPSLNEAFSLASLEAMYCKVPCIQTEVGGMPSLRKKFGPFWISLGLNPTIRRIAAAIESVANMDQIQLQQQIEKAYEIVKTHYNVERMVKQWAQYIYEILELPWPNETTSVGSNA